MVRRARTANLCRSDSPSTLRSFVVFVIPVLIASTVFCTASASPAHAQGWIEERPTRPNLPPSDVVRTASHTRILIDGRIARVEVEELFRNNGGGVAEGSYLYPMPGEAVFTNFSLWMGDQELRGEAIDADKARSIYEEIVRRRKDPALLTFAGHGLVRAQVFPFQPGETRKVVLRFTQLLPRAGDALRVRYSLGERGNGSDGTVAIAASGAEDYGTPYSPTHNLTTSRSGDRLEISLPADAAGELELFLPLRHGIVGTSLVTHSPGGEEGYFMLLLAPAEAHGSVVVPRDVTLVVDVSGSMSGTKLEQAKAALQQALGTLGTNDRFRLIAFSSAVRRFQDGYVAASAANIAAARQFIDTLGADGGTNISGALEAALEGSSHGERLPVLIFLTDGIPSVGEQAPDRIAEQAAARAGETRIFTVGLGHDVNTYLIDRLAAGGRGSAEYVPPGTSVETAMGSLMSKLRFPALVDLRIGDSPVRLSQMFPSKLPDLFFGEELVVFGRYQGQGNGNIEVSGKRNGRSERIEVRAVFPSLEQGNDFIPRLWASRQIGELTRQIRLEGTSTSLINRVRDLGLRYGILTEYTSYLVQEPVNVAGQGPVPARDESMDRAVAPAAQTGAQSFERARTSAKLSEVKTLARADEVATDRLNGLTSSAGALASKRVAGRIFVKRGAVWTDIRHADRISVTEIAAYSQAYFDLVRQLPEVAPYLSVGDVVVIAGSRESIRIASSGVEVWKPGRLAELVRNFRGT